MTFLLSGGTIPLLWSEPQLWTWVETLGSQLGPLQRHGMVVGQYRCTRYRDARLEDDALPDRRAETRSFGATKLFMHARNSLDFKRLQRTTISGEAPEYGRDLITENEPHEHRRR